MPRISRGKARHSEIGMPVIAIHELEDLPIVTAWTRRKSGNLPIIQEIHK